MNTRSFSLILPLPSLHISRGKDILWLFMLWHIPRGQVHTLKIDQRSLIGEVGDGRMDEIA